MKLSFALHSATVYSSVRFVLFGVSLTVAATCLAEDFFVTIGGGSEPGSNQVSLENNVKFFQRTLASVRSDQPQCKTYFADGDIAKRDLQFIDSDRTVSEATRWMTTLMGDFDNLKINYRNSEVPNLTGPARKVHLKQTFFELADQLSAADRLFIYVTTHGGPAAGEESSYEDYESYYESSVSGTSYNKFDTTISLWNNEELTAKEFSDWLDDFNPGVQIVMVMTQCYSGGFARTIFEDADPRHGLSPSKRCGFFSQSYDLPSTGCTPQIDESTYRDYSTYFWEAISGTSRTGEAVDDCDFNTDGVISLAEAHAHCLIVADSMDVPETTSEILLRRFSEIGKPVPQTETLEEESTGFLGSLFGGSKSKQDDSGDEPADADDPVDAAATDQLMTVNATLAECVQIARNEQAAVINSIANELNIELTAPVASVRKKLRALAKKVETMESKISQNASLRYGYLTEIRGAVTRQYPELGLHGFHPLMSTMLSDESQAAEFVQFIQDYPTARAFEDSLTQSETLLEKLSLLENRHARAARLFRTLQNVILEQNLPMVASTEQVQRVGQIIAMESGCLN